MRTFPRLAGLSLSAASLLPHASISQNLPDAWHLSSDGLVLYTGGEESTGLYREDTVRTIILDFSQSDWWTQLESNYDTGTPIPATLIFDGQTYDSVGVKFKGETSYFMLPPGTQKMSFDINMDEWIGGQDLKGYESFNLHNSFQDNSFMRDVVSRHLMRRHIPAMKAGYIKLLINGENWGLYPIVQDFDGDYANEWWFSNEGTRWRAQDPDGGIGGTWGDGTAALNYLGPDTSMYQEHYTLKKANKAQPWDDLVKVCDELNNTPIADLEDSLDRYMNVDRTLWFLATENAFADDDSYIHKGKSDYCLYWEPESGRMTPQEIDGNSVFSSMNLNWSPFYHASDVNYPLLNRLLAVPELRQRYLAHLRTIIAEELDATLTTQLIDDYHTLIDTIVQNDPRKLMSYPQFTSAVSQLPTFITTRRNSLNGNGEVIQVAPAIANTEHQVDAGIGEDPQAGEAVDVRTTVTSGSGLNSVTLFYSATLWGRFSRLAMLDDGAHNDGGAGDGVYGATIPGMGTGTWVRYYIEAKASNSALSAKYDPIGAEHDVYVYNVAIPMAPATGVVVNEIMASNSITHVDEAGEFEDWIELYNNNSSQVDVGLWFVSDTPFEPYKWRLPIGTSIPANGYLIVWCDEEAGDGDEHANFKLSASGEGVLLLNADSLLVDEVYFGDQVTDLGYARVPNGSGPFQIQTATFAANNNLVIGLSEIGSDPEISLFPNPASTSITLVGGSGAEREVVISDATGRTLWSGNMRDRLTLDVSAWSQGSYLVRAGGAVSRFMVMR